jgi:hypothetical protein
VSVEDPRFPRPRRPARDEIPRRRQRTRRLLLAVLLGLAAILAGTQALLDAKPVASTEHLLIDDLPSLAIDETRTCTRHTDDPAADEIAAEFIHGGRVTSSQVYACPSAFDGLRVSFIGEAIGEVLPRRGGAWVQVNDDDYALQHGPIGRHLEQAGFNTGISVWLPDGLHERIEGVGRPEVRGDVLALDGVLMRADPADGGGITLRADRMEVLASATEVPELLHTLQAIIAAVLATIALLALVWSRRARQR